MATKEEMEEGYWNHVAEYLESCFKQGHMLACTRTLKSIYLCEKHPKTFALWALTCGMNGDFHFALRSLKDIHKNKNVKFAREGWFEWNISYFELGLGRYQEGWANYEYGRTLGTRPTRIKGDEWDGSYLGPDKTLAVWTEQGSGDIIQFVRFLKLIKERSGAKLVLETAPQLTALLRNSPAVKDYVELVCPLERESQPVLADFHTSIMSVGHVCQVYDEDLMRSDPYIVPDAKLAETAEKMFADEYGAGEQLRVGVVWAGSDKHRNNAQRSIPMECLEPFKDIPNVCWVSLQTGVDDCPEWAKNLGAEIQIWDQTAAIISALDLVVCCDTAVAHLAAAMGKRVFMMVSAGPCWRWKNSGSVTHWYDTLTIYRQPSLYDWESVVKTVSEDIRKLAVEKLGADTTEAHLGDVAAAV